jgi:hypothetical protein
VVIKSGSECRTSNTTTLDHHTHLYIATLLRRSSINSVIHSHHHYTSHSCNIGYFVLDNAFNNDTAITSLASKIGFNDTHRRLRCGPHTLDLISQTLLWGNDADAYDNEVGEAVDVDEECKGAMD